MATELGEFAKLGEVEPMKYVLIALALACCGCDDTPWKAPVTNEELVRQAGICRINDLDIHVVRKSPDYGGTVLGFQCVPKGDR